MELGFGRATKTNFIAVYGCVCAFELSGKESLLVLGFLDFAALWLLH
jgi:hypothetical protein